MLLLLSRASRPLVVAVSIALAVGCVATAKAQATGAPTPAVDYSSLLQTRFFPDRGMFDLGDVDLVFPPPTDGREAEFLVRTASGEIVSRQRLGWYTDPGDPAFTTLNSVAGVAGDGENPVQAGRYSLDVEVLGDLVGSVPFTVEQLSSGDAFNPVTTLRLEGPWRTHAYFSHETDRPDYILELNAWIRPDEVVENVRNDYESVEVSVRRDGREVAWGFSTVYTTRYTEWSFQSFHLYTPESRDAFADRASRSTNWTVEDVTPGPYEVVLSTEAGPFRSFAIEGMTGGFVAHPRSAIDYEPRASFLTQRTPKLSLYWMAPME